MRALWFSGAAAIVCVLSVGACGGGSSSNGAQSQQSVEAGSPDDGGDVPADDGGVDSGGDAARDAGADSAGGPYPAFQPAMPQAVSGGGSVMTAPHVVPIVFSGDPQAAGIVDMLNHVPGSAYWSTVTKDYGVGAMTVASAVTETTPPAATISDDDIRAFLAGRLDGAHAGYPAPTPNTIYAIFYPAGVTITLQGEQSCTSFGGYHYESQLAGGTPFVYAVLPRCDPFIDQHGIDATTFATSHELFEAATDPFPVSSPAYDRVDNPHFAWSRVFLGELGDLCTQASSLTWRLEGTSYTMERMWSNASAKTWHDPCVPIPAGEVFFNAAPVLSDSIQVTDPSFGTTLTTKGVKIPVGTSKTIELDLFSDAPTSGPFSLQAYDYGALAAQSQPTMSFSFDKTSGRNGDRVHLTITVESQFTDGYGTVLVLSSLGSRQTYWPFIVGY